MRPGDGEVSGSAPDHGDKPRGSLGLRGSLKLGGSAVPAKANAAAGSGIGGGCGDGIAGGGMVRARRRQGQQQREQAAIRRKLGRIVSGNLRRGRNRSRLDAWHTRLPLEPLVVSGGGRGGRRKRAQRGPRQKNVSALRPLAARRDIACADRSTEAGQRLGPGPAALPTRSR